MGNDSLQVHLRTINDRVKFTAGARDNPELTIDYFPPLGEGEGYTSLELLLISLSSCVATTLLVILRTIMKKTVDSLEINAKGTVREEHPRALSHIRLEMLVKALDVEDADCKRALAIAEQRLCPVWSMLKGNVEISVSYAIKKP